MTSSIQTLNFNGTALRVIEHAGQNWLTAEQVGHCLGYGKDAARAGIVNLYNRHSDEFTEADTCVINLMMQVQYRDVRIFSPSGCNKLGFFASTPRAKEFRTWASRVLAGQSAAVEAVAPLDRMAASMEVMAESMTVMAHGVDTVLTQMNVTGRYITMLEMHQRGNAKLTPELFDQVQLLLAQGMPQMSIARLLRLSKSAVSRIAVGHTTRDHVGGDSSPEIAHVLQQMIDTRRSELLAKGRIRLQKVS